MSNPLLEQLNDKQKEAVLATEGPVLVLAGAGSGKTKVLTHRIAYILDQKLAQPNEILAVTFTNKAAGEIKERIEKLLTQKKASGNWAYGYSLPWAGTFHSICARILRIDGENIGIGRNFVIYDPTDQQKLIRDILKELNLSTKDYSPKGVLSVISSAKNELLSPKDFAPHAYGPFQQTVAQIFPLYQKALKNAGALDFDDLIGKTIELLKIPEFKDKYQRIFKYILVDEYQDTNYAQYLLIKILGQKHANIFVVGDDAQSIYKWRGADIRNILNFEKDNKATKVIKLEQNYRSTKVILDATNHIIKNNSEQKPKKLWTENKEGDLIKVYESYDEKDEANFIAETIRGSQASLNKIAVLYRTNAQSRQIEEAMINFNIPYRLIGNVKFYDRKEIKDIIAYLRILANENDDVNLERIINFPKRGLGKTTITELKYLSSREDISILNLLNNAEILSQNFNSGHNKKLRDFAALIENLKLKMQNTNLLDFIKYLLEETKILEEYDDQTEEGQAKIENIKEFLTFASKYKDSIAIEIMTEFLEDISLLQDYSKERSTTTSEAVNLMTIHSAKGLEFDLVFVAGLEENLFPHSRSYVDPAELEEERRLAYVAFTRAKEKLYLTYAQNRRFMGSLNTTIISRFIGELPSELLEFLAGSESVLEDTWEEVEGDFEASTDDTPKEYFNIKPGDKVKNQYFGIGTILSIDADTIKIQFQKAGIKELATEYARLEKL
ncbi:UvrD-helicase domain-containing protein [Candidatus Dojkabacteria bacterium]|nr:UvrD-helicase domain-containing protein [Candidatus Dojkabacteria bacterium]